jgi:hypothetical protein
VLWINSLALIGTLGDSGCFTVSRGIKVFRVFFGLIWAFIVVKNDTDGVGVLEEIDGWGCNDFLRGERYWVIRCEGSTHPSNLFPTKKLGFLFGVSSRLSLD